MAFCYLSDMLNSEPSTDINIEVMETRNIVVPSKLRPSDDISQTDHPSLTHGGEMYVERLRL